MHIYYSDSLVALFLEASLSGSTLRALSFVFEFGVVGRGSDVALPSGWSVGPPECPGSFVFRGGSHIWPSGFGVIFLQVGSSPGWFGHYYAD